MHASSKRTDSSVKKYLQETLETSPSDETIERIAREQYGMHRPGEIVYRIEAKQTEEK